MAEFKYALTRVCLRSGTLTLPRTMLDLFPDEGSVEVLDTLSNEVHELHIEGPRTVTGLGPLFEHHGLDVNDELLIRPLDDGTYTVTPLPRERTPDWRSPDVLSDLLDEIVEVGTPLTEQEIRALHPTIPDDVDLAELLDADPRLARSEGRWRAVSERDAAAEQDERDDVDAMADAFAETSDVVGETERDPPVRLRGEPSVFEVPQAGPNLAGAGLNSEQMPGDLRAVQRARRALEVVGFDVEARGHGQLMATADLGRRSFKVLVHTLPAGERLDWASLLARRRDTGARYLAVFGDHRDLLRLNAPAELARATLWSWDGVQRMLDLTRTVLVSPVDLEPHFERGGMFEHGLARFEQTVSRRIDERGAFSAVLGRLATLRAPAIFLLEDLAADVDLQRDQLLRILERLGEAPFHLVSRVDSGEFCLRYRVADALGQVSDYALSLRARLPDRRRERVKGLGADDGADEAVAVPSGSVWRSSSSLAVPLFGDDADH